MRVLRYFLRAYPWQTALMLACLLLAAAAEGVGLSTLVPVLGLAFQQGGAPAHAPAGFEATVTATLRRVGIEPTLGSLFAVVTAALWLKGALVLLSKRQVGYTVAWAATDLRLNLLRALSLDAVNVGHGGQAVLEGASIEVSAVGITAILGPSGAGKTTIVDLLTGLVRPDAGTVKLDGVPLDDVDLGLWRAMIGYVPQELFLLNDSVRINVSLGDPELSDADVVSALRDAGALEFVNALPERLEAPVGERGMLLSGGQRQRIAIARAIVRRPKLLVLDEATVALDAVHEAAIWQTVARLAEHTAVVAISHQPALVQFADRVYRIQNGKVQREIGSE